VEARQHLDAHRVGVEALAERVEVLASEHRGRHEHGNLAADHGAQIRRPQRDLGLAIADVSAHDAVHRLLAREVAHDLGDRLLLILGLFEREVRLELFVVGVRPRERVARVMGAKRFELEQLVRELQDRFLRLALRARPLLRAEPRERRRSARARVFLDEVDAVYWR
jgi:hypothetical protein